MPVSASQAARHYAARRDEAQDAVRRFESLSQRVQALREEVEAALAPALAALAAAYLPALSAEALARAERLTGYRGYTRRRPLEAMAHEAAVLGKTIHRVEADAR